MALALQQVDHNVCLMPSPNDGWVLRPAREFAKGETVIRIDGDWERRSQTASDKGCIYWREEFSRSSLGRISQRFWLRGRFTRDLWPHVRAVDIKTAATLVVVRDAKGQGLRLDAAMELQLWSCEFTVAVKIGRIGRGVQIRNIRVDTHIIGLLTCWCIVVCHAIVVPNASCLAQSK